MDLPENHRSQTGQLPSDRPGVYWWHHLVKWHSCRPCSQSQQFPGRIIQIWSPCKLGETKLMHVGDGADPPPIAIWSTTTHFTDSFNYLGSLILSIGDLSRKVHWHCGPATAIMQSLWNPLWRQNSVSHHTKLCIYKVSVLLVLFYSSETWLLSQ